MSVCQTLNFCKVLFLCLLLYPFICLFFKYLWNAYEPGILLGARINAVNRTNQAFALLDPIF